MYIIIQKYRHRESVYAAGKILDAEQTVNW